MSNFQTISRKTIHPLHIFLVLYTNLEEHLPVLEVAHGLAQPRQGAVTELSVADCGLGPAIQSEVRR